MTTTRVGPYHLVAVSKPARKVFCMYKTLILVILLALVLIPAGSGAKEAKKAATIDSLQAQSMLSLEPKTTFLIDVRTRAQYTLLGHPPPGLQCALALCQQRFPG